MRGQRLFVNPFKSSPTVRMRKGRCKLQWIATNIFILFGLIFIIIELELIKKEINTIKKQTQKGTGFFRLTSEIVTNIRHHHQCRGLPELTFSCNRFILIVLFGVLILDHIAEFLPWPMGQFHMELKRKHARLTK